MKKILLLLTALFVMGGVEVSAKKLNADLSKLGNGPVSTWDSSTSTITWTSQSNNMITNFDFPSGDYRSYDKIVVSVSNLNNAVGVRVQIRANGQEKVIPLNGDGIHTKSLTTDFGFSTSDFENLEWIRLLGSGYWDGESHQISSETPASAKINAVYLEGPDINYIESNVVYEIPNGSLDVKSLTGTNTDWASTVVYPKEFAVQGAAFGDGNGDKESTHVNVDGYDYINFVVTGAANSCGLRVWMWDDVNEKVVTLFAYPVEDYETAEWTTAARVAGKGTYVAKISGYKYLKGVKAANDWGSPSVTVSLAYVSKGAPTPYNPSNKYALIGEVAGSASLTAALADESAVVFDATGVTGTDLTLTPANPNAIFIAEEGTLSNTKNVQIGNTIAKLEITDKKPLADLTGVTATDATYTRSMTNKFGTICLPYAVTSTESVKYYTIDNLDGDVLTLKEETVLAAGTPAIVEKVSGESITAEGSGALVAAGAPTGNLELIGTFEEKTVLAADYAGKNIYAIQNNQFVQGLNSITVPAFRAYFTADASAEANLRLAFGDEATAIDSLTGEKSIKAIYSVSGASQASLQKGMNIVEFTDGSVKKVMVK